MTSKRCMKCSSDLKWKTILKAFTISMGHEFKCDNCKTKYSIGLISRGINLYLITLPVCFFREITGNITGNLIITIILYIIWATIVLLLSPCFASIRLEEK